jgi:hypothetical protein
MSIHPPPDKAPYPVAEFLALPAGASAQASESGQSIGLTVEIGVFFDGTNNHMGRDRFGQRVAVPSAQGEPLAQPALSPEACSHSNVARLFSAFPSDRAADGYFRYYIQGVGTPFPEIGEATESEDGKAFAKGGQPRILWGLFQVMNAMHMLVHAAPLYSDQRLGELTRAYDKEIGQIEYGSDAPPLSHEDWFAPHLVRLQAALKNRSGREIASLKLSVFGFSRGAAEAVAFCHFFDQLLSAGRLAGIAASIRFLGVFDVVASVGGSASMARTLPVSSSLFDGHWAWAKYVDDPLPDCVENGLHCIAAHELRMNFPVTRPEGKMQEMYFPGVHSDVGGGYAPGDQGRARAGQASLLSQIPLLHMLKTARLAGVPFLAFNAMEVRDQQDMLVDSSLAEAWDAYCAALNGHGHLLKKHMELYYRWRAARLTTLESTQSYLAASPQDRQDMAEANRMLAGDLEAMRFRRTDLASPFPTADIQPRYGQSDSKRVNQWHWIRANNRSPFDDWESWAIAIFDNPWPLPLAVEAFFDDYVHDSFAGFYMAGEVTEFDRRKKVAEVMAKGPGQRNNFDEKIFQLTLKVREAQCKKKTGVALSAEEARLLNVAEFSTPYPVMTDDDAGAMRSAAILTQTSTRREGGGYLIRRGYFP